MLVLNKLFKFNVKSTHTKTVTRAIAGKALVTIKTLRRTRGL